VHKQKHLLGIESFRGFAALLVFLFHFWAIARVDSASLNSFFSPFMVAGYRGVDIFFVLSGFLLFHSLYNREQTLSEYFVRRLKRILPLYYFSLLIFLIFREPQLFSTQAGWIDILRHLTFTHVFWAESFSTINPVLWTLSHEMFFYLVLPLLFWLGGKRGWRILLVVGGMIALSLAYRMYIFQHYYPGLDEVRKFTLTEQFPGKLDQFAVGMLASFVFIKMTELKMLKRIKSLMFLLLLASSVTFYVLLSTSAELGAAMRAMPLFQAGFGFVFAAVFAVLLLSFLTTFELVRKIFANPLLTFMGLISYSFYIWHYNILETLSTTALASSHLFFALSFVLITGISALTYWLIEKPFLRSRG